MLDIKQLRQDSDNIAKALERRHFVLDVTTWQQLDQERKALQVTVETLQSQRNKQSAQVGEAKQAGQPINRLVTDLKGINADLNTAESKLVELQQRLHAFLAAIPNLPHVSVPTGQDAAANQVIRVWGQVPEFSFPPRDHVALGTLHCTMDFEAASQLAGSRFVVLTGKLARLHRALSQFMLDVHTKQHGYQEVSVPYIVKADILFGTGQLPKFKDDVFALASEQECYLISTAEVPVTNLVRERILEEKLLPIKYVCHSACFRSEAGSYGKDIRGMLRQHQFEKVELVQIVQPNDSYLVLEELTQHAEKILQLLKLPYRVVSLCGGDLGFAAAKTYDLEVWLPGQQAYREISSCSNMEAFQARRMKARYRTHSGDIVYVHTLNGSGLAVGRTLVAVLENYQNETGNIVIPEVLRPYMDDMVAI